MTKTTTVYINFTGGIVSPGFLNDVLELATECGIKQVRFGLRQQLIMDIPVKVYDTFTQRCSEEKIHFTNTKEEAPNIVSSYPAAGIFTTDGWLREGVYKDIFDLFDYTPKLKINICDSTQCLVPFFTGHINWVSSSSTHFWHLHIRFPRTHVVYQWPDLVYTNDVPHLSKRIEQVITTDQAFFANEEANGQHLYQQVNALGFYVSKATEQELILPKFSLPYYEGLNASANQLWLGIYRRDELFSVALLQDICSICMDTRIGQLYTTPWKSIIIKGIEQKHTELWEYTLGQHRINVRHAANELNWQVEDNNDEGLTLKRFIIRHFDKEDIRTHGLSFAIQTKPTSRMFGSVMIRKLAVKNPDRRKSLERYDILYSNNFNPNSSKLQLFRHKVEKEHLGVYLASLCKYFYQQEQLQKLSLQEYKSEEPVTQVTPAQARQVHQCKHCLSVYEEEWGNEENNLPAKTPFAHLPPTYTCSLCEAPKEDFLVVDEKTLKLQSA